MRHLSIEVGILIRGQIRRELEKAVFYEQLTSFKELKGLLSSQFLLTDPAPSVVQWLRNVEKDLE